MRDAFSAATAMRVQSLNALGQPYLLVGKRRRSARRGAKSLGIPLRHGRSRRARTATLRLAAELTEAMSSKISWKTSAD